MATPSRQTQRIMRDCEELHKNTPSFIENLTFIPAESSTGSESLNEITGFMLGPDGSDYAGGRFEFRLQFPPEYPFRPPDVCFKTKIVHPNIDSSMYVVCNDQLVATWSAKITLTEILTRTYDLLANPNYATPLEGDNNSEKTPEEARKSAQESRSASNNS